MLKLKSYSIINRRNNWAGSKTKTTPSGRGGQKESRTTTKTTTKIIDEKPAGESAIEAQATQQTSTNTFTKIIGGVMMEKQQKIQQQQKLLNEMQK